MDGRARRSSNKKPVSARPRWDRLILGLSPRKQALVRPILEHPRDYVLLSLRGLARQLHQDPSTMLRTVQSMGFGSYAAFRQHLHDLSAVLATPLDLMQTGREDGDMPSRLRSSLDQDIGGLQSLRQNVDFKRIANLATRLYEARRIVLLGGDMAAALVAFLEWNLTILGLPVSSATSPGSTAHRVRSLGRQDMVLAISFRRGLRQTVEGLREARRRGAYCVGISDTWLSPLHRFAHECFHSSIEGPSFAGSYVAPMALLNLIIVASANRRLSRTIKLLKSAEEEQRHGFRWFPNDA
jgi:RpiR family transcriptional regulator, carbohydrate utilization regulator